MTNIFGEYDKTQPSDMELVVLAQRGSREALETLIQRHQDWIYNIALRMTGSPEDAEDVTQEILIKIMTKLSTFQGKSSFRTWVYRIVANHVITMQKQSREHFFRSLEGHGALIDLTPDLDLPDQQSVPVDVKLLVEETRLGCMSGTLLCLDRTQRLVFILGGILSVNSEIGGEIMEISPENFRQQLSRARKQLNNFMEEKCGVMNPANPCRCARKTKAAIIAGYIDPERLGFHREHLANVKTLVAQHTDNVDDILDLKAELAFQEQPFWKSPDYVSMVAKLLQRDELQGMLNFN